MKTYLTEINKYYDFEENPNFYDVKLSHKDMDNSLYKYMINSYNLSFNDIVELYKIVIYKQYSNIYKVLCTDLSIILYIFHGLIINLDDNICVNMLNFILLNTSYTDLHILFYNSINYFSNKLIDCICSTKANIFYKLILNVDDRERDILINLLLTNEKSINSCLLYLIISQLNIDISKFSNDIKIYIYLYELIYQKLKIIISKEVIIDILNNIIINYDKYRLYKLNYNYRKNRNKKINYELIYDIFDTFSDRYILSYNDIDKVIKNHNFITMLCFLYSSTKLPLGNYIKDNVDIVKNNLNDKIIDDMNNKYKQNNKTTKKVNKLKQNIILNKITNIPKTILNYNDIDILDEINNIKSTIDINETKNETKISQDNLNNNELILTIIDSVCNIKIVKLRISIVDKLIEITKDKKYKKILLKKIIVIISQNKDLDLLKYIITNYNINDMDKDLLYFQVKHNFDNNNQLIKMIFYLCGNSDKFNL